MGIHSGGQYRGIAQLVEQWSPKPRAEGSSPSAPAMPPQANVACGAFLQKPQVCPSGHFFPLKTSKYFLYPFNRINHQTQCLCGFDDFLLSLIFVLESKSQFCSNKIDVCYSNCPCTLSKLSDFPPFYSVLPSCGCSLVAVKAENESERAPCHKNAYYG